MKRGRIKIEGLQTIRNNLRRVEKNMKSNLHSAMVEVVADVQRFSMKRSPIDTGNLQGSHRSRVEKTWRGIRGAIWVTAAYALFVHEAPPSTRFQSPWPRGRKFLERGITDNLNAIKVRLKKWLT